ncbi:hypothetical protein AMJ39_07740 [candidate division TA06 bacterium DG_24]|uniref:peptidylprolyl isomerase n=3 Tax=Bacteria division TA06 TaxID=1156500 RepID=A0A0S8JQ44_UNCT6|nr:MAG: hypothetical protein AMJ39_07740 [candidate division TA06 bacterium DG_24]KPK70285.1 MAG: hypothetical protein AMJ82_03495 [candidate division TA06 bacterium SM23_40]KPL10750.1 MAG: hypothetical protein AMJ71_02050 [candidate division TA06 bacterium SM1_40]
MRSSQVVLTLWKGLAIICLVLVVAGCQRAGREEVLARVGSARITQADFDALLEEVPPYARAQYTTEEGKKQLLDIMVRWEVLSRAARDEGIDKREDIATRLNSIEKRLLSETYDGEVLRAMAGVPRSDFEAYYREHKEDFRIKPSVTVSHILFETEEEALAARQRLEDGEDFAALAGELSKDLATRGAGGSVGVVVKDEPIPGLGNLEEFVVAAFALPVGQVSHPVETSRGYHLIKVTGKDAGGYEELDTVMERIRDEILVSDEDIEAYYGENPDEFIEPEKADVRHVLCETEAQARRVLRRLEGGADFEEMVETYSTDRGTKNRGGRIGFVTKGRRIPYVGSSEEFEEAVFALQPGEIGGPIHTDKGYHVIRVDSREESYTKTLDEVRDEVRRKLLPERQRQGAEDAYEALKTRYRVRIMGEEEPEVGQHTFDDLFKLAEEAQAQEKPEEAINYYREVMNRFPDHREAYKAQFMIGFVYSEMLTDYDKAKVAFQVVIDRYPECDLADDARWMIDNMGTNAVPFEPTGTLTADKTTMGMS